MTAQPIVDPPDRVTEIRRSLLQAVAGPDAPAVAGAEKEPWRIESDGSADWALGQLGEARSEIADVEAAADAQRARITAWVESETAAARRWATTLETELVRYLRRKREAVDDEKKKPRSVSVPNGRVQFRRSTSIEVTDREAFIAWAVEHKYEAAVKRPAPEPLVSAIKPHLAEHNGRLVAVTKDGEQVPGILITINDENPTVTPAPQA